MKNKLSIIVVAVFMIGLVACSKNSPSVVTPVVDNNPSVTLNGQTTDLTGTTKAYYTSASINADTVVIVNTSTTDTSFITNLLNLNSVSSSVNYLELKIAAFHTIAENTTYTRVATNTVNLGAGFQVGGQRYSSKGNANCIITVESVNPTFISGSYTIDADNETNGIDSKTYTFTGKFKAYF